MRKKLENILRALIELLAAISCLFGIHWSGRKGLGMWGDANRCRRCGAYAYGLLVIKEER